MGKSGALEYPKFLSDGHRNGSYRFSKSKCIQNLRKERNSWPLLVHFSRECNYWQWMVPENLVADPCYNYNRKKSISFSHSTTMILINPKMSSWFRGMIISRQAQAKMVQFDKKTFSKKQDEWIWRAYQFIPSQSPSNNAPFIRILGSPLPLLSTPSSLYSSYSPLWLNAQNWIETFQDRTKISSRHDAPTPCPSKMLVLARSSLSALNARNLFICLCFHILNPFWLWDLCRRNGKMEKKSFLRQWASEWSKKDYVLMKDFLQT